MISLTFVLAALVLLTLWDASENEQARQVIPVDSADRSSSSPR